MSQQESKNKKEKKPTSPLFKASPLNLKPINHQIVINPEVQNVVFDIGDEVPLDLEALQENEQIVNQSPASDKAQDQTDKHLETSEKLEEKQASKKPKTKEVIKKSAATSPLLSQLHFKHKEELSSPLPLTKSANTRTQTSPQIIENSESEERPKVPLPKNGGISKFLKSKPVAQSQQKSSRFERPNVQNEDEDMFRRHLPTQQPSFSFKQMLSSDFEQTVLVDEVIPPYPAKTPLIHTLIQQGIPAQTALKARRQLIAIFETAATLKYRPDRITADGFEINNQNNIDKYREERRRIVEKKLGDICKLYDENKPNEVAGFSLGIASVYMPSRVFYGYTPAPDFEKLSFVDPLQIEDEIDYDEDTAGFDAPDQSEEESEDTEESVEEDVQIGEAKIDEDKDPEEYYRQLVQGNRQEIDDLGLEDDAGQLKVQGMKQQKQLFDFLGKRQQDFGFPVPVLCPEALQGQTCCFYEFESSFKGMNIDQLRTLESQGKHLPEHSSQPKKNIANDQVTITNCNVPQFMRPVFLNVGKDLEEFQNLLQDDDFEFYMEEEAQDD